MHLLSYMSKIIHIYDYISRRLIHMYEHNSFRPIFMYDHISLRLIHVYDQLSIRLIKYMTISRSVLYIFDYKSFRLT